MQVIPASAVSEQDGSIDTTQAREVSVELGSNDSTYVEILSGLEEGDLVLVSNDAAGAGGEGAYAAVTSA